MYSWPQKPLRAGKGDGETHPQEAKILDGIDSCQMGLRTLARLSFLICQFRSKSLIRWEFSRSLSYQRSSAILIYSEDRCEHAWDNGPVVPHPELFLFYGAGRVGNSGL